MRVWARLLQLLLVLRGGLAGLAAAVRCAQLARSARTMDPHNARAMHAPCAHNAHMMHSQCAQELEEGPWHQANLDAGSSKVIPVPTPLGGAIVLGESVISYFATQQPTRSTQIKPNTAIQVGAVSVAGWSVPPRLHARTHARMHVRKCTHANARKSHAQPTTTPTGICPRIPPLHSCGVACTRPSARVP